MGARISGVRPEIMWILPSETSLSYTRPRIGGAVYFDCLDTHESPYEDVQDWSIEPTLKRVFLGF